MSANWKYPDGHLLYGRDVEAFVVLHPAVEHGCFFVSVCHLVDPVGPPVGTWVTSGESMHGDLIDATLSSLGVNPDCINSDDGRVVERWAMNLWQIDAIGTVEEQAIDCVYFIRAQSGDIKIGCTSNVKRRLKALQTSAGEPLELLATMPGKHAAETRLHQRFHHLRKSGEWFSPAPELLAFVESLEVVNAL